jgi:hypothetical protein
MKKEDNKTLFAIPIEYTLGLRSLLGRKRRMDDQGFYGCDIHGDSEQVVSGEV